MKTNKKKIILIILSIIFLAITVYACYKLFPLLYSLKDSEKREAFKVKIQNLGAGGWFAILALQIIQVFIAFIPGEIVEILAGILYGTVGGLIVCLFGLAIATVMIYYTVKLFANKYTEKYKDKLKSYSFLNNPKKIHIYFFILFSIPGIPKDIFIYLVPFLPIRLSTFLLISLIARIPSTLSSTIVGDSLIKGDFLLSTIVFISFTILGILGILFNDKLIALFSKKGKTESEASKKGENQ